MWALDVLPLILVVLGAAVGIWWMEREIAKVSARRCVQCGTCWPSDPRFVRCPECDSGTCFTTGSEPVDMREAEMALRRSQFERYYQTREEQYRKKEIAELEAILELD